MHAVIRIALWVLAVLLVLLIGAYTYLRNADLSVYEAQVEGFLSEKIGHKVDIRGLFELQFGNVTHVTAEQITVTNPEWPSEPTILSVGHLSLSIELWSLVKGPIVIQELAVQRVIVHLERNEQNRGNWEKAGAAAETNARWRINAGNFIAFRQIRVQDVQISFSDSQRRKPLNISLEYLTVTPDASSVLDLDLRASINEMPLWADGKLGPWTNLIDGKDISADLNLFLGDSSLAVDGYIADLFRLEGIETSLKLQGPAIDSVINALGIPPFAEGEFEINASIDAEDTGTLINLDGKLGEITIFASGNIDNFVNPGRAEFDFNFAGPNAKYVAEVFGFGNVTQAPFQVSGQFAMNGRRYALSNIEAHFATGDLRIDGWIDLTQPLPDGDISISSSGPDLSVVGALSGIRGIPADAFALQGRIRKIGAAWRFDDFIFQVGANRFGISGELDSSNAAVDQIEVTASGPDISMLQDMTGLQGIPARPYDVSVRLKPDAAGLRLENAVGVFGDNRLEIEGVLGIRDRLAGTNLSIRASGPELHNVSLLTGVPFLPTGPFEFAVHARIDNDTLTIENATAAVTGIEATADGTIGLAPAGAEFDLQLSASGPDLRQLGLSFGYDSLPAKTVTLSTEINGTPTGFAIENLVARIGEDDIVGEFTADLREKPEITGSISSTYIDLASEMPESAEEEGEEEADAATEFLFSNEPLDNSWLHSANFDVELSVGRAILRLADVHDVHVRVRLRDGKLDIDPLTFREMDGSVAGRFHLEPADNGYSLDATLSIENMHIGLKTSPDEDRSLLPPLGGHFEITGTGKSAHELLASSHGQLDFRQGAGRLRAAFVLTVLGDLVTEVIRMVNPLSKSQSYTSLECGIYSVDITDGIATLNDFVLQSDKLTVIMSGDVNFKNERLNITLRSKPREGFGISLGGVVNSLLKLGGTLQEPRLNIDPASSVTTTGAAIATGGLSLIARGLWDRVTAHADLCAEQDD